MLASLFGVGGAALRLPAASISPWPHCLFPTSVLLRLLVSVQHGLNLCPFLAQGPQGFSFKSQEGVTVWCRVCSQQHGQFCLLAAWLGFWMVEDAPERGMPACGKQAGNQVEPQGFPCRAVPGSGTRPFLFGVTIGVGRSPRRCQASRREGATCSAGFDEAAPVSEQWGLLPLSIQPPCPQGASGLCS